MKTLAAFLTLICYSTLAQDSLIRGGNFLGSAQPRQQSPQEIAQEQQSWNVMQQATMTRAIDGHAFRRIDGKIQNMRAVGGVKSGRVYSLGDDGIIVVQEGGMSDVHYWALKNYPKEAVADKHIEVAAVKSGVYNWRETPLQLWDYGILLTPDEEKQKRDDAEAVQMKIQQQRIEVARMKAFIANSNAVVRLQLQATNGAAWAQCSLGLHYLKGEGCETNREQAIYWLQKAALQGDLQASNKLSGLK